MLQRQVYRKLEKKGDGFLTHASHVSLGAVLSSSGLSSPLQSDRSSPEFSSKSAATAESSSSSGRILIASEAPNTLARLTVQRSIDISQIRPIAHPQGIRFVQLDPQVLDLQIPQALQIIEALQSDLISQTQLTESHVVCDKAVDTCTGEILAVPASGVHLIM